MIFLATSVMAITKTETKMIAPIVEKVLKPGLTGPEGWNSDIGGISVGVGI